MQPLDLVGGYMQMQGGWVKGAAEADGSADFPLRLEAEGVLVRVDHGETPDAFRGPIISQDELTKLRQIDNVVRRGRVRRISPSTLDMTDGPAPGDPRHVYVDCTAQGVRATVPRPIFEPGLITLQYVTIGIVPWGAATIGTVEALRDDDQEKNRLCPPLVFSSSADDMVALAHAGMSGLMARGAEADIAAWDESCRLNPGRGAMNHLDDPRVGAAFTTMATHIGAAMRNLEQLAVSVG